MQTNPKGPLNVEAWLRDRGVEFRRKAAKSDGRTVYQIQCPFDESHKMGDACIMQDDKGKMSAKCLHNSCCDRHFWEFRKAIGAPGPQHHAPPRYSNTDFGQPASAAFSLDAVSTSEFMAMEFDDSYLINGLIAAGEPLVVGGPKKVLKTSQCLDIMISLATGTKALGRFKVEAAVPCMIISGESGMRTLQKTALAIADSKGVDLDYMAENLRWGFKLPALSDPYHCDAIRDEIEKHELKALFVDPAYLALLAGAAAGTKASDLFSMGPILKNYGDIGAETGCVMCLVHHTTKGAARAGLLELSDLSQSGFAEWARQWIIVNRRTSYDVGSGFHQLCLTVGGSAGHSGAYAVDIDEGRQDGEIVQAKQWQISCMRYAEAAEKDRADKDATANANLEADKGQIRTALLSEEAVRDGGLTKNAIRKASGKGKDRTETVVGLMLDSGEIEEVSGGRYILYKLVEN